MIPRDNRESWQVLRQDLFSDYWPPGWTSWLAMAIQLVVSLEHLGLGEYFRAGRSMEVLNLSTQDQHDLYGAPFVELLPEPDRNSVRVSFVPATHQTDSLQFEQVSVPLGSCIPVILGHLRKLWIETKPGVPLPACILPNE